MRISDFSFGSVKVGGKRFNTDLIVSWDGEIKEKDGSHEFTKDDLHDLLLKDPEIIILGTGTAGNVQISPDVKNLLKNDSIQLITKETSKAIEEFNKHAKSKKAIAVLHLTC